MGGFGQTGLVQGRQRICLMKLAQRRQDFDNFERLLGEIFNWGSGGGRPQTGCAPVSTA